MSDAWLVVGLGNPGPTYARNRHNAGFQVADRLAETLGERFGSRSRAQVAETRLPPLGGVPGPRLVIAKPAVFMNESGGPVAALTQFFGVEPARLLVVHDELELPLGEIRLKFGGGEGGHNGLRSISKSVKTRDYLRLRLGIGRPPGRQDPADFVLRDVPNAEKADWGVMIESAVDDVERVVRGELSAL
ncbi:aminoacyl-tRNA hydrolase [Spongisporangium articulatum]|uniref:Peptidyl-tRNA hydrolase n=1 Tax=Spongisporangium articulatum TaxID=3362603 RepID=A0ABW8AQR3_9ACTN